MKFYYCLDIPDGANKVELSSGQNDIEQLANCGTGMAAAA